MHIMYTLVFLLLSILSIFPGLQNDWKELFNGQNLAGWEVKGAAESNFYVKNGILVAETKLVLPNTFLATERTYADSF